MASAGSMNTTESLRHFLLTFADDTKVHIIKNPFLFVPNDKHPTAKVQVIAGGGQRYVMNKSKVADDVTPALLANKVVAMELKTYGYEHGHCLTAALYPTSNEPGKCAVVIIDSNAPSTVLPFDRMSTVLHDIFETALARAGKSATMQIKFWSPQGMMTIGPQKASGAAWAASMRAFLGKYGAPGTDQRAAMLEVNREVSRNKPYVVEELLKKFVHPTLDGQILLRSGTSELAWPLGTCQWWSLWFVFCIACWPEKDLGQVFNDAIAVMTRHMVKPVSDFNKGRAMMRFIVRFAMQILSYQDVRYNADTKSVSINGRVSMRDVPPSFESTPVPAYALDM